MAQEELNFLLIMGGVFVVLGIITYLWGNREDSIYYDSLSTKHDMREFLDKSPRRPEFDALRIGGRLAVVIGIILLLFAGGYWLWG